MKFIDKILSKTPVVLRDIITIIIAIALLSFTTTPQAQSLDYVVDQHYDISIASFNSTVLDVSAQETIPFTMLFNKDGSTLYLGGQTGDDINQYDLTVAFDISTATFNRVVFKETRFTSNLYSMLFNDGGARLYLLESSGRIWQYILSTPYDIATAISPEFTPSVLQISHSYDPVDMIYNDNGSILYVLDLNSKDIYQYDLSRPYDISSAIEVGSIISLDNSLVFAISMVFNSDGTKLFVANSGTNDIHQYNLSTAYDISTASFSHIALDLAVYGDNITSLLFDDNGSRLYVAGGIGGSSSIKQYDINKTIYTETLSNDGAIDNSSPLIINLTSDTFTTSSGALPSNQYSVGNVPAGLTPVLTIDGTGTQATLTLTGYAGAHDDIHDISDLTFAFTDSAFTSGDAANVVNSGFSSAYSTDVPVDFLDDFRLDYRLTAIGDFTTAAYTGVALDPGHTSAMVFNNNGHILYTVGTDRNIHQFNLLREYDISTAIYAGIVLDVSGQVISTVSIMFNNDGSKLYLLSFESKKVKQYNLSSAYDISTASFAVNALSILAQESHPRSMMFNNDGTILYVIGLDSSDNSIITQYNLAIAYDITTASFDQVVLNVSAQERVPISMLFSKDGSKLYVMGFVDDEINQYDLAIPYDISTASFDRISFSIAVEEPGSKSMVLNGDGSTVYVLGRFNGISQYDISASVYHETSANDGFIDNSRPLVIELSDGTFTTNSTSLPTNQYSITGVPAGLTAALNIDASATKATLTFSGAADNHQDLDDILANLNFSFSDAAFTSGDASNIINSGSISPFGFNVSFDFDDNITMTYALGSYTENSANLGGIDNSNPLTISLAGDITTGSFTTTSGPLPSELYRIGRVPAGLTPILTIDSTGSLATLTFSGTADPHQSNSNVTYLLIRFYDGAFTNNDSDIIINSGFRPNNAYVAAVAIEFDDNAILDYVIDRYYDISIADFNSDVLTANTTGNEYKLKSMLFNHDGSKLYLLDRLNQNIYEHTLSVPYDISTAGSQSLSYSISAWTTYPNTIIFNNYGSKLYVLDSYTDIITQYPLAIAYDISSANYGGVAFDAKIYANSQRAYGLKYNNDGTKLYILFKDSGGFIFHYNLASAYDISTASLDLNDFELSIGQPLGTVEDMIFTNNGFNLYVLGSQGFTLQYKLNTAYDILTATYMGRALDAGAHVVASSSMLFNADGSKLYFLDESDDKISQYDINLTVYPESMANDGSIDNTNPITINLTGDTFSTSSGALPSNQYTIGNLPTGLTPTLTIDNSATQATLTLSGTVNLHQDVHDILNLTIVFSDAAFSNIEASGVLNSGFFTPYSTNVGIDFEDNPGFPIAVDNNYLVNVNGSVDINPLNGDNDPQGDPLAIISINGINLVNFTAQSIPVNNGAVDITIGNFISFTPDTNFYGTVSFPYIISDGNGGTATANQIIVVDVDALISGNVTGLNGSLQIQNNGGDNLQINSNGSYQFSSLLNSGDNYLVSVAVNPTSPNQTCVLMNNSGTIVDADINNIDINCTTNKYFIGGSVNGLLRDNFMFLQNNLSNDLLLFNSNTFVFSQPLDDQSSYSISIETQALNPIQPCTVVNGSSNLAGSDITDVEINCEIGDDFIYRDDFEFQQP